MNQAEFRNLEQTWYKKLAEAGFVDIEVTFNTHKYLKEYSDNVYRQANKEERLEKLTYFSLLMSCSQETTFPNDIDAIVMYGRAEGLTRKEIVNKLKNFGFTRHRLTVGFIIRRYENLWGIRKWKPEQLRHQ